MRAAATVVLIGLLFWVFDAGAILRRLGSIDPSDAIVAVAVLCLQYLIGGLRWHYILLRHDLSSRLSRSFVIYGAASLANVVVPHTIAGMSVKGVMLKGQGVTTSRMFGVLLVERLAAGCGLAVCMLVSLALSFPRWRAAFASLDKPIAAAVLLASAALLAVGALVLWRSPGIRAFAKDIHATFLKPSVLIMLVLFSTVIIYLGFLCVVVLAEGMGVGVTMPEIFIAMPFVTFVAALPVSLGGWGV
ncbi:MAG: lysylphosphatidylglycerol synthase transmembrane domain-containing protein, partial [Pseudomonadota bacterium]|nr:lysylphosphatidylglycerol synthase transmembrane domain-containing protein [Pseudomonadota bacterium]